MSDPVAAVFQAAEASRWKLPSVDGSNDAAHSEDVSEEEELPALPTAEEIAQWEAEARQKGYEEGQQSGYTAGLEAGRAAGDAEIQAKIAHFSQLIACLQHPFEELDEQVEREIMQMTVVLAQQLVRREIRLEPGEIIGVIRESMALLPANKRHVSVNLHPEDAALLRETLASSDTDNNWNLVDDPLVTRGGCHISTEVSHLDVTLESRLASLAATMLGGERESDA